jgi:UDP-N-acetylglucosamine 2-epimerase (non-hydrolysing)/GDP/UDP-N,N'-diacetylbacillosamine 2-epimerase (hydrolysing)
LPRSICVVTGTRAEYGQLYWLMREIADDPELALEVIATGMHLAPAFGSTVNEIERDGFHVMRVEMLLASDSGVGTAKSVGLGVIGLADALDRLRPDFVVLLGDRFETFAAAQAAHMLKIPIAHLSGGDSTEGAFDEAIRHSITKMAHLHFVTNDVAARRVRQLGENPKHIHNVGSPGIDYLLKMRFLGRDQLNAELQLPLRERNILITYHPVTLDRQPAGEQIAELLAALDSLGDGVGLIFTRPNADPAGYEISSAIDAFVESHPNARVYASLGQTRYLSVMKLVDAVVGNSSSGLTEAPSLKKPTVNIGERQRGRVLAASVIESECRRDAIREAIDRAFALDCTNAVNPYGDGQSSARIKRVLKELADPSALLRKHFFAAEASV